MNTKNETEVAQADTITQRRNPPIHVCMELTYRDTYDLWRVQSPELVPIQEYLFKNPELLDTLVKSKKGFYPEVCKFGESKFGCFSYAGIRANKEDMIVITMTEGDLEDAIVEHIKQSGAMFLQCASEGTAYAVYRG